MNFLRKYWTNILIAAAVVLLIVAICAAVVSRKDTAAAPPSHTEMASPATTPSPAAPASTTPLPSDGQYDEPEQIDSDRTCDKRIGDPATTTFQKNVFAYEVLRLSPPSVANAESMKALATSQYILDHSGDYTDSSEPGRDITLSSNTVASEALCKVQSNGDRLMSVVSVITTSRIVDGQTVIVNENFETPQHQTIWTQVQGVWKVNNE